MALITSDCDAMRIHAHQMALITSGCAPCRDNWASIMYEYQECMGTHTVAVYFTITFTALNFVLLPIFVSIFLDNFSLSEEQRRQKQVELYVKSTYAKSRGMLSALDVKYINMGVRFLYKGSRVLKKVPANLIGNAGDDFSDAVPRLDSSVDRRNPLDELDEVADGEEEMGDKALGIFGPAHAVRTTGAATLQISRRYYIHPQVNVLTKHV